MRRGLIRPLGALILGLVLAAGWGRASSPCLVLIPCTVPGVAARIAGEGLVPVRIVDGYALAWGDRGTASGKGQVLCARDPSLRYAVAYLAGRRGGAREPLDEIGAVLARGPSTAVLAYDPRDADRLLDSYEILPIHDRPILFRDASRAGLPPLPDEPDRTITAFVEQVDRDRLLEVVTILEGFGTRRSNKPQAFEAGDRIRAWFQDAGLADATLHDFNAWADNVVAVQRGTLHPDEIYVVGAHYDSYASSGPEPGADDNATGTAAVLEAARILAPLETEATIVYIAFCGEEQGLVGSEAWAREASAAGLDIRGVINLDMIGYRAFEDPADLDIIFDPQSEPLRDFAIRATELYLPELPAVPGYFTSGNSDQQSFWDFGYPAITLHEDSDLSSPYIHTPQDRVGISLNDIDFMERNVRATLAMLASLARPLRVRIDHEPIDDPPTWAEGYRIAAEIEGVAPIDPDSVWVAYRVDGSAFARAPLQRREAVWFEATIPRQPPGARVDYYIHARDIEGRESDEPSGAPARLFSFRVGRSVRFADDFEIDRGWIVGAPGDAATSGVWTRTEPIATGAQPGEDATPDSGRICFVTGNGKPDGEIGAADVDGGATTLMSPPIDLAELRDVQLSFRYWFVDETFEDDSLLVGVSWDDGATWREAASIRLSSRAWRSMTIDSLEAGGGGAGVLRVRFVVSDRGNPSLLEAAIDEIVVRAVSPRVEAPPAAISRIVQLLPNPFRHSVSVVYDLLAQETITLSIHDPTGRRVALLDRGVRPPGRHEVVWDSRERVDEIANGIYFARLELGGGRVSSRSMLRLR